MKMAECTTTPSTIAPPGRFRINLPNQITILRLLLSIVFFVCLAQFDGRAASPRLRLLDVSAALFIVAGLTDILDGYLARKYKQVTSFGRVIDPFVDKILVIGAYAFLAGNGFVNPHGQNISGVAAWMVVIILARELLVTSIRGVSEASGKAFGANVYGKAKMLLQVVTVCWVLFALAHPVQPDSTLLWRFLVGCKPVMLYLTVFVTVLSMIPYLWSARAVLSQTSASSS
ncbi:MAG TPA: CDP-diacylglycerol--glycerol-3-phosphate 3-phosphatidyltransferase [Phycisphaerae bacterium]|jgi:CDP-diacylglycerol--glycerol-3-phosphate 3-phosphatidyltransferase|nr:CDP-diacylglycerol--glycerol-3-phosphate 3-phosphatidyltransferase [Phycisphaerae bacterium]HPP20253.1 CDP-diacylglycerol--glycerol-3-phosphate 3-phosphatidyltransferase [Phycisphaerae bacterium]